jgi:hypothetical protein
MKQKSNVPATVRRKLAADYRKQAADPKWTAAERAEYVRMAEAWERTLASPKKT